MAYYSVVSSFPVGDSTSRIFRRRDFAADYAYKEIRAQFEAQALLDRPCCPIALAKLPDALYGAMVRPMASRLFMLHF